MKECLLKLLNPFSYKNLHQKQINKEEIGLFSLKRKINKQKRIYIAKYNMETTEYFINNKIFSTYDQLIDEALKL